VADNANVANVLGEIRFHNILLFPVSEAASALWEVLGDAHGIGPSCC
jgi:hypothetical protein